MTLSFSFILPDRKGKGGSLKGGRNKGPVLKRYQEKGQRGEDAIGVLFKQKILMVQRCLHPKHALKKGEWSTLNHLGNVLEEHFQMLKVQIWNAFVHSSQASAKNQLQQPPFQGMPCCCFTKN